jgi:nicotinamidase-related amidase
MVEGDGMTKALIVIDYTYDFIADDGKLTCGLPGQEIEESILELVTDFAAASDYVVFAVDVHDLNDHRHPESRLFPPHNLRDTPGRDLYGKVGNYFTTLQATGLPAHIEWMDKTRYSAFAGTDLDLKLRSRGVNELHLVGVCTDICVLHTAIDAYNLGYTVVVHKNSVASFNPTGHEWALEHFTATLGATVVE